MIDLNVKFKTIKYGLKKKIGKFLDIGTIKQKFSQKHDLSIH